MKEEIASKKDLNSMEMTLKSEFTLLKSDLKAEMKLLEQRITIKMGSMIGAAVVLIVTLQKIL